MEPPKKKHIIRTLFLIALLAVVCIIGTLLAACRLEDPVFFRKITAPVTATFQKAGLVASKEFIRVETAASEGLHNFQTGAEEVWNNLSEQAADTWAELQATPTPVPTPEPEPDLDQAAAPPSIQGPRILADYTITKFTVQDDLEILTGGNVAIHYYNQADELWSSRPFGPDPIGRYGCGPTALSMAISSLTGEEIDPAQMANWASLAGYCSPGHGSHLSIVPGSAEHFGLSCVSLDVPDENTLLETLSNGGLIVALMGPGHFTRNGHFILLRGSTLSGEILVADPSSRENSLTLWDPQIILSELTGSRASGAPLWLLSTLEESENAQEEGV